MRSATLLALCLPLAACSVYVDSEGKEPDSGKLHISIGGFGGIKGNGKLASEARPITALRVVESDSVVDVMVELVPGSTPTLQVEADENLLSKISTVQEGDKLVIRTKGAFSTDQHVRAILTLPTLARVSNQGSGDMTVRGLDAERFELDASGPGDVTLKGKVKQLQLANSGSSDISLEGVEVGQLKLRLSGPGDVSIDGHIADLDARLSGSGDLQLSGLSGAANMRLDGPGTATLVGKITSLQAWLGGSGGIAVQGLDGGTVGIEGHGPGDVELSGKASGLKVALSGSGSLDASGLSVTDVDVILSGPGDVTLGSVQAERFNAHLSGSGDLAASGKTKQLAVEVSGPGNAVLSGLVAQDADLQTSGSGDITAGVMATLRAHTSGPGEIQVHGKPAVREMQGRGIMVQG
ncbi:head GIN domain-containing protein [Chitinimonas naiadis]